MPIISTQCEYSVNYMWILIIQICEVEITICNVNESVDRDAILDSYKYTAGAKSSRPVNFRANSK